MIRREAAMRTVDEKLNARIRAVTEGRFAAQEEDPVNFDTVRRFVRLRWRTIVSWTGAACLGGLVFLATSISYYTAYTTVLLEPSYWTPQNATNPYPALDPSTYVNSQIELIRSDEVLEAVTTRLSLARDPEFGASAGLYARTTEWVRARVKALFYPPSSPPNPEAAKRQSTISRIRYALSIRRVGLSDAVEIAFTSQKPDGAENVANAIAAAYISGQLDQKREARAEAAALLKERLAELRAKAFTSESAEFAPPAAGPLTTNNAREHFQELQTNAEVYRRLYNDLLQREYADSNFEFASSGRVITPAKAPLDKSWPGGALTLAVSAAIGFAVGFAHALFKHAADRTLTSADELEGLVNKSRIRTVPPILLFRWRKLRTKGSGLHASYSAYSTRIAHALGQLAIQVQDGHSDSGCKTIGIGGSDLGVGASTIAVHLAGLLAEIGHRTLIVDANWTRRTGTAELWRPSVTLPELVDSSATLELGHTHVDVLLVNARGRPSEMGTALHIRNLIRSYRPQPSYDFMIVDFCSSSESHDLETSLSSLDDIIIVAEPGRSSCDNLQSLINSVPDGKLRAVVLNKT